MAFQVAYTTEIQFLIYLIPVMLGVQMAIYFYWQYFRTRTAKLRLNRVLLSFGTFTLMVITAAFCNMTDRIYGLSVGGDSLLRQFGFTLGMVSPLGFMVFIAIPEFNKIINVKAAWVLIGLSVLPIIVLLTLGSRSPFFIPTLLFTALNAYYLILFQVKLIRVSLGSIRKKLILVFIGELFALSAIPFAVTVVLSVGNNIDVKWLIGIALLLTGFVIMFVAANDFPAFLEFDWALNLRKFFIIDRNSNTFLYTHNFEKIPEDGERATMRDEIFSGGIAGLEQLIASVTGGEREEITRIDQEDSIILLEYGKVGISIIYALVVKKDLVSLRYFLQKLKEHFESFYKNILTTLEALRVGEGQERLFLSFGRIVKRLQEGEAR